MDLLGLRQLIIAVSQIDLLSLMGCQTLIDVSLQMPLKLLDWQVMEVLHFVESIESCYKL